jgi:hypothetical protein
MPWVMAYDMRPMDTLKEKHKLLSEAVAGNWVLYFEHDPRNECCTLHEVDGRIKVKDIFTLAELDSRILG